MGTILRFPVAQPEPDSTALNASTIKAYQLLMDAFTEMVGANEEHKYMLTIAIYEILSGDLGPLVVDGVSKGRFDGVTFPSIAARGNLVNFALQPQVVDSSLELFRVEAFEVTGNGTQNMMFTQLEPAFLLLMARFNGANLKTNSKLNCR